MPIEFETEQQEDGLYTIIVRDRNNRESDYVEDVPKEEISQTIEQLKLEHYYVDDWVKEVPGIEFHVDSSIIGSQWTSDSFGQKQRYVQITWYVQLKKGDFSYRTSWEVHVLQPASADTTVRGEEPTQQEVLFDLVRRALDILQYRFDEPKTDELRDDPPNETGMFVAWIDDLNLLEQVIHDKRSIHDIYEDWQKEWKVKKAIDQLVDLLYYQRMLDAAHAVRIE